MYQYPKEYDVIVIGAGHAGVEAALAAARLGCQTLMLSINLDTIGQMSCNPAIGGLAKGHLTREIDAIGGEMGKATDMAGLQFRMLNTKKGSSVQAPRAQCDKKAYQFRLKWICERESNLDVKQGHAIKLIHCDGEIRAVRTSLGVTFLSKTVVITTGTFLRGLMHIGANQESGGRSGEFAASSLSGSLQELGLNLARLKTGTPPRLNRRSIEFASTEIQLGDDPVPYFTFWKDDLFHMELPEDLGRCMRNSNGKYPPGSILDRINGQLPCYVTYTTKATADLVRENLHLSPMYSGVIESVGPRYCPSIEDKIVRFSHKERHQVFLEPEGIATEEVYVNGLSTCLPFDVQVALIRTISGCEMAEIMRPAYAVEYDYANPTQLHSSLETKCCRNLYLAGQINGTSGYEEAAAQGLMAGINAARRVRGANPIVLRRDQAYIGVLIDDLVTKGTTEPYRMFTSRAEYRLILRQDNADLRLSAIGHEIGLLGSSNYKKVQLKAQAIDNEIIRLNTTRSGCSTLAQILSRPETAYADLPMQNDSISDEVIQQVETAIKYAGYIERQENDITKFKNLEGKQIPDWIDYSLIPSIRTEARHKLSAVRPSTLGQASRISGVSPADINLLMVWMKRGPKESGRSETGANALPV